MVAFYSTKVDLLGNIQLHDGDECVYVSICLQKCYLYPFCDVHSPNSNLQARRCRGLLEQNKESLWAKRSQRTIFFIKKRAIMYDVFWSFLWVLKQCPQFDSNLRYHSAHSFYKQWDWRIGILSTAKEKLYTCTLSYIKVVLKTWTLDEFHFLTFIKLERRDKSITSVT